MYNDPINVVAIDHKRSKDFASVFTTVKVFIDSEANYFEAIMQAYVELYPHEHLGVIPEIIFIDKNLKCEFIWNEIPITQEIIQVEKPHAKHSLDVQKEPL